MLIVKTINSMEKVFPDTEPCENEVQNVILSNQKFNLQLAIKNLSDYASKLNTITVGGELAEYVSLRTVELVPASFLPVASDDYYISRGIGLYPDLLCPIDKKGVTIPAGQWKSVYVTIYNPDGIKAGDHTLTFTVKNENGEEDANLSYDLKVLDLSLPKTDIALTNWMHYDCISNQHNTRLFDDDFYKIFSKYLKAYTECGNNMLLVALFTPPLDTLVGGERKTAQLVKVFKSGEHYTFSFEDLKRFIKFAQSHGIEFFEFSHLFTQWGGASCPKIVVSQNGEEKTIFGWDTQADSKEYKAFLNAFLPELVKGVYELKIEDKCYFHLTDEPGKEHLERYAACRNIVKAHLKDLPIIDAMSSYEFYEQGLVDIPAVLTPHYSDFTKNGLQDIFAYYCCVPSNDFYSNRFLNIPLQRLRILGFQLYLNKSKGFLHWGFNFYNTAFSLEGINPYFDTCAGGMFPAGDSFIVYPAKDDVLMTIRAEAMREAVQDYRLCKLVETQLGEDEVIKLLADFKLCGFNEYPHSITEHEKIRQKLVLLINKM